MERILVVTKDCSRLIPASEADILLPERRSLFVRAMDRCVRLLHKVASPAKKYVEVPPTGRINFDSLDFLRFVTALCVLLFHYELFVRPHVEADNRWFLNFDRGVDFFFILSGFVITHNYHNKVGTTSEIISFFTKRIARIYPLHLLLLIVAVALYESAHYLGLQVNNAAPYDFHYIGGQLLLMHAWGIHDHLTFNTVSWSVSAEWFLYLCFPVLAAMTARISLAASFVGLFLLVGALELAAPLLGHSWTRGSYDFGNIRALPSFIFGMLLWYFWKSCERKISIPWTVVVGIYAAAIFAMIYRVPDEAIIALFGLVILSSAFAENSHPLSRAIGHPMQILGNASYGLYMVHLLVGHVVFTGLAPRVAILASHPILTAVVAAAISIGGAIASYAYFENPLRKKLGSMSGFPIRTRANPS